jgi:hypothetical protein
VELAEIACGGTKRDFLIKLDKYANIGYNRKKRYF